MPRPLNFRTFGSLENTRLKSIIWLIRESIWLDKKVSCLVLDSCSSLLTTSKVTLFEYVYTIMIGTNSTIIRLFILANKLNLLQDFSFTTLFEYVYTIMIGTNSTIIRLFILANKLNLLQDFSFTIIKAWLKPIFVPPDNAPNKSLCEPNKVI
ncbi:hypothetical protein D3C73_524860 [compost metagenome]